VVKRDALFSAFVPSEWMRDETGFFTRATTVMPRRLRRDPRRFPVAAELCEGESFYGKYVRALGEGGRSGLGDSRRRLRGRQVVEALRAAGFAASGLDVAPPEIAGLPGYDGRVILFPDASFSAVGAFNVLEHVEEPIAFLDEMARVVKAGGRMVVFQPELPARAGLAGLSSAHGRGSPEGAKPAHAAGARAALPAGARHDPFRTDGAALARVAAAGRRCNRRDQFV